MTHPAPAMRDHPSLCKREGKNEIEFRITSNENNVFEREFSPLFSEERGRFVEDESGVSQNRRLSNQPTNLVV